MHSVRVGDITICNSLPLVLIAGPCQIESYDHAMMMAKSLSIIATKINIPFIFKSSYDKANRSSIDGKRGLGIDEGLKVLQSIKNEFGCPLLTDVHKESDCDIAAKVVDILQIPAFLCRQTDLLVAAARTNKIVNVKKGQFLSPYEIGNIAKKIEYAGNNKILLTERGSSFGYNNLVVDMRSFPIMSKVGYPVIFDATHSTQSPGGLGTSSGGDRTMVPYLARAAVACGVAGVFMEVHDNPDCAPSDGQCMVKLENLERILIDLKKIDMIVKSA